MTDLINERIVKCRDDFFTICKLNGFKVAEINGKSRKREFFLKRVAVAKELRRLGHSLPAIGAVMGKRCHTSILYYLMPRDERDRKNKNYGKSKK